MRKKNRRSKRLQKKCHSPRNPWFRWLADKTRNICSSQLTLESSQFTSWAYNCNPRAPYTFALLLTYWPLAINKVDARPSVLTASHQPYWASLQCVYQFPWRSGHFLLPSIGGAHTSESRVPPAGRQNPKYLSSPQLTLENR